MSAKTPSYHGYRFPPKITRPAVWPHYRFSLSFRDVEDLLAKRGVIATDEIIRQWPRKLGAEYARTSSGEKAALAAHGIWTSFL